MKQNKATLRPLLIAVCLGFGVMRTEAQSQSVTILDFKMKTTDTTDGLVNASFIVKILNPQQLTLRVCLSVEDADGFEVENFCRSDGLPYGSPELFRHNGDTTVFKYARLVSKGAKNANVTVQAQ